VLRRCPDHGPSESDADAGEGGDGGATAGDPRGDGSGCPVCGRAGETLLSAERRERLSKFVSGTLRRFPDDAGPTPGEREWVAWDALVDAVADRYSWADEGALAAVVTADPKGRFERDGGRVRATYGHSIDVDLEPTEAPVPDRLYHGTPRRNAGAIREGGLGPMGRQAVHLSADPATARQVGRRHGDDPVVFAVDAAGLLADGYRVTGPGRATYTVERVPTAYLSGVDEDGGRDGAASDRG